MRVFFRLMKIIYNNFIPFRGFLAINLFGVVFVRGPKACINQRILNHERIHSAQIRELGYIFFYLIYLIEWLIRIPFKGNAYRNISFEKEAYRHENDLSYLSRRPLWAMWRKH